MSAVRNRPRPPAKRPPADHGRGSLASGSDISGSSQDGRAAARAAGPCARWPPAATGLLRQGDHCPRSLGTDRQSGAPRSLARALAESLRDLFLPFQVSVRRYAARCHTDPGTISRYLNGSRIAPWPFVRQLLVELGEERQTPIRAEVHEHVRQLHRAALQAGNRGRYEVQNLQDQLEQADRVHRQANLREQALLEALQSRQRRIAELEMRQQEIEASRERESLESSATLARLEASAESNTQEINRLRQEIADLQLQLDLAKEGAAESEARCVNLEQRLEEAEARADSGSESRINEELDNALQQVTEARAEAERLRRLVEEMRDRRHETVTQSRRYKDKKPEEVSVLISTPPKALAGQLLQLSATWEETEYCSLLRDIGLRYPAESVVELTRELEGSEQSDAARKVLVSSAERNTADVLAISVGWGSEYSSDGLIRNGHSVISWHVWDRPSSCFTQMIEAIRDSPAINSGELEEVAFASAAANQSSAGFAEIIAELSPDDRVALARAAGAHRDPSKIAGLVIRLTESGRLESVDEILNEMVQVRPAAARQLARNFRSLNLAEEGLKLEEKLSDLSSDTTSD